MLTEYYTRPLKNSICTGATTQEHIVEVNGSVLGAEGESSHGRHIDCTGKDIRPIPLIYDYLNGIVG